MNFPVQIFRSPEQFTIDPEYITAPTPKVLWIELTSKCPFDCIFCTRRVRFGAGQNLDFDIFKRVISDLESPDFIGLNYSGESIYYPRLLEAIACARSTGAFTELVTAFSTISPPLLREIVASGLDRLAVSLHTMDPQQYREIYQLGSLETLKRRVGEFFELKASLRVQKPQLDFCFVAMKKNLDQLPRLAEYAKEVGVSGIFIHPIIGRHLVPHDFSSELSSNQLREEFKDALRDTIAQVRTSFPELSIEVLNPDLDVDPRLNHIPAYFAPSLPSGARIHTCDQSPFESVHILASGNVVVCEVLDEFPLGNLRDQSLREIWHGQKYRDFRQRYVAATSPECRSCVWKKAYIPGQWSSKIAVADGMSPQLLRGWHSHEGEGIIWSKKQAVVALRNPNAGTRLRIAGVLPHAPNAGINSVSVTCNHDAIGTIKNTTSSFANIETVFSLPRSMEIVYVEFRAEHLYRPSLHSNSVDTRDLGFALQHIEVTP